MRVRVSAFGDVGRHLKERAGHEEFELASGATVSHLLQTIGIKPDAQLTIGVNGELGRLETPLHDGDHVMLVTPMEGGSAHA